MEYYYSFVCLMLASSCWYTDCSKVSRLTGLVQLIATRLDTESIARQQDMTNLLDKLNYLELRLNESSDNFQCSNTGQPENDQSSTRETGEVANNGNLVRIMKAFQEEKKIVKILQQQAPGTSKKVNSFEKMLGNLTNIVEEMRGKMCTSADQDSVSTIDMIEEVFNPVKKEFTEKLSNISETIDNRFTASQQDLERRQDVDSLARQQDTANLLEKFNYLELRLNESNDNFNTVTMELTEKLDKLSEAMQNLSAKVENAVKSTLPMIGKISSTTVDEMADRSDQTTVTTTMDMTENTVKPTSPTIEKMDSCLSHYKEGRTDNGVYTVYPLEDNNPVKVYCDMTTDGGGWTVFQRREDGSVDFYRDWQDYKQGFGTLTGEFWLGNDKIAALTSTGGHELRVDLEDFDGASKYAKYGTFKVLPESDNYRLEVSRYSGNANDSLGWHNGMEFSTKDRDNDKLGGYSCAQEYKGGWWYGRCHLANLNGLYLNGPNTAYRKGVNWYHWRGYSYSLKITEMKLR